ncbi:MAG: menaquinone biosynthesis decarboxylase [Thermodesulfobacteriota bacterium]|nr:menaquinone biosynthesis decarboxylase [Thermodesulfobacteriota bacterium]
MVKNLRKFIDVLDEAGELTRVTKEVDPVLEISRLTDRESKKPQGGKALFFTHVRGSGFPVATNLFGSPGRIRMALNVDELDDLGHRVQQYIDLHPPRSFKDILGLIPLVTDVVKFFPRSFRSKCPPCQEVVYTHGDVDLGRLPVLKCWPKDAGRFITLPLVFTRSLSTGKRNVGMYRMQVFDKNTTGMHWHIHKDGAHYYDEYACAGRRMPVAVAIGADPATVYTATAPLPRGMDEMVLAGFIRRKPVRLAQCLTINLAVPAEAEFILEGYVQPGELRREGPFGDHTGYYSLADKYPVFHITALTHRQNPIYQTTLVGRPPMEDCYLAKATERLFLPMLRTVMPEIRDYYFPWEGVFHNIVVVSIDKAYAGHAQKVISGLWGQGQMSFCKAIVVVDADIDPQDPGQVLRTLIRRLDIRSDLAHTTGILDVLDHSSPSPNFGHKIGIDLTERVTGEPPRSEPKSLHCQPFSHLSAESLKTSVDGIVALRELMTEQPNGPNQRIRLIAIAITKSDHRGGQAFAEEILNNGVLAPLDIVILFDASIDLYDESRLLWKLFNNVDPGRDLFVRNSQMVIDACNKGPMDGHHRQWPDELTFD